MRPRYIRTSELRCSGRCGRDQLLPGRLSRCYGRRFLEEMVILSEKAKVVVAKEQVSSNLGGEAAILNLKNGVYYGLDSVGARVWALIQQPRTIAELRDILAAEYDVATPRLEADLFELLSNLASKELVEVASGDAFASN